MRIIDGVIISPRQGKLRRFLMDWRNGRKDHFPVCCILRFSIEQALKDGKTIPFSKGAAVRRGVVENYPGTDSRFVPCNVFHHKTKPYRWEI